MSIHGPVFSTLPAFTVHLRQNAFYKLKTKDRSDSYTFCATKRPIERDKED